MDTELDERVIGMTLDQLQKVPRSIAVAGGKRKVSAIKGALAGSLIFSPGDRHQHGSRGH